MDLADSGMLLRKELQAWLERVGHFELVIKALVCILAVEADLHLLDGGDEGLGLLSQFMFLTADVSDDDKPVETHLVTSRSWLWSVSDRAAKSSDSLESRSWLGTPISSNSSCSLLMMVETCFSR
jgi:hypothetical protein